MTYQQALDFLYKQLPMYQNQGKSAYKKDLSNTKAICEILGSPQKEFKSIHIAGTNGKGSSAHMLASVFQEAGYKTGLYTSPHLKDFRERIRINGEMIDEATVIEFIEDYQSQFSLIGPSFFEWTVGLAFHTFEREKVDIAIIETGLGGRLDSTNVIHPELSLITNIGLDHTEMLGDTLNLIANEKAGIIKNEVPVVIADASGQEDVFNKVAKENKASIHFAEELKTNVELTTDLLGNYQKKNIAGVHQAWLVLRKLGWKISFIQLQSGLQSVVSNTRIRGRWEMLSENPKIVADTAHNIEALSSTLNQLTQQKFNALHFVLGFVKDKKVAEILALFPKTANYYFCQAKIQRAMDTDELLQIAKEQGLTGTPKGSVSEALGAAKENAQEGDIIYIGGSTFVVAEAI